MNARKAVGPVRTSDMTLNPEADLSTIAFSEPPSDKARNNVAHTYDPVAIALFRYDNYKTIVLFEGRWIKP